MSIPTVEKINQFGDIIDSVIASRTLVMISNQNITSDSLIAVTSLDSEYTTETAGLYRYSAIINYSAGSSGIVFSLPNMVKLVGTSVAQFFNASGTNTVDIQTGGNPVWTCAASNISDEGLMLLNGYFEASDVRTLTIHARRETASGTLILRSGSMFTFTKIANS